MNLVTGESLLEDHCQKGRVKSPDDESPTVAEDAKDNREDFGEKSLLVLSWDLMFL